MHKYVSVLVTHSYLTLCDAMDYSLLRSSVRGILQVRTLEWVVIPFSRGSSQFRDWTQVSCITSGFFYHLSHQGSPKCINTTINVALHLENTWSMLVEDPLEDGLATHSSILAGKIPWTEEPSGLQSMGPHRVDLTGVTEQPVLLKVDTERDCSFWGMVKWSKNILDGNF